MNKTANKNILILEKDLPATRKVLFEFALNWTQKGYTVIYITTKKIEQFPATHAGATSFNVAYKNILFFYYETYGALINYLMEIHSWAVTPKLLIIESLHNYLDAKRGAELWLKESALLLATAHAAVECCSQKLKEPCYSVISISNDHVPPHHTASGPSKHHSCLDVISDLYYYKIPPLLCTDIDVKNKWNK